MCLEKSHSRKNKRGLRQPINTANLTCTLTHHSLFSALHQGVDGDSSQALLVNYFHFVLSLINKTSQWQKLLDLLSKEDISKEASPPPPIIPDFCSTYTCSMHKSTQTSYYSDLHAFLLCQRCLKLISPLLFLDYAFRYPYTPEVESKPHNCSENIQRHEDIMLVYNLSLVCPRSQGSAKLPRCYKRALADFLRILQKWDNLLKKSSSLSFK